MKLWQQLVIDVHVRVRALVGRRALRARFDEEARFHQDMRFDQLVAAGLDPESARQQARREFGNPPAWRDRTSDIWRYGSMERFTQDLRYGLRTLWRSPGYTALAVIVLGLGIGVNTFVFSLVNAWFVRPLAVAEPDRLVRVYSNRFSNTRLPAFEEYRARNNTLEGLTAFAFSTFGLRLGGDTELVHGELVSGEYFSVLGIAPAHGRLLSPVDDRPGASPAVVVSHRFWRRRLGGDAAVVGRTLSLNDQTFTVVGVTPESFPGVLAPLRGELWVSLTSDAILRPALDASSRTRSLSLHMIGRLREGVDLEMAQANLEVLARERRAREKDAVTERAISVYAATTLHPEVARPVTAFTAMLMAVVGVVLLIVCVNVANLALARASTRSAELAVRQSLGAGRGRLIQQLLTEHLLLSVAGSAIGLAMTFWLTALVSNVVLPAPVPLEINLPIDVRVLAFAVVIAGLATVAFGLAPALSASRIDLARALTSTRGPGPRQRRLRAALLVAQVSFSVLLLVTAGLFVQSARRAQGADLGFDATPILTANVDLETRGYDEARAIPFLSTLVTELRSAPGVVAAHVLETIPVTLSNNAGYLLRDRDAAPQPGERPETPMVYSNAVGPGHFETLQLPLVAGRDFTDQDRDDAPRVVIVNELMAERFWPGQNPIGQRVRPLGSDPSSADVAQVVGVARNSTYVRVGEEPMPFMYRPFAQAYSSRVVLMVRTAGNPDDARSTVREVVRRLDPGLAVYNAMPLIDANAISLLPARVAGQLLGAMGVFALVLAALGIYGVLSFLVRSRTREIGIRVAVGATPGRVAMLVVRQALTWTVVGATLGLLLAAALTRFLSGFLYGISPHDPWTLAVVTVVLGVVAALAALVPAWHASRLDPLVALRQL